MCACKSQRSKRALTLSILRLLSSKAQELKISLQIIITLSSWYSLESPHRVLSDEYPFARVSVIFQLFSHYFVLIKLATSSIRVKVVMSARQFYRALSKTIDDICNMNL